MSVLYRLVGVEHGQGQLQASTISANTLEGWRRGTGSWGEGREAFLLLPSVNKIERILTDLLQVMCPSI